MTERTSHGVKGRKVAARSKRASARRTRPRVKQKRWSAEVMRTSDALDLDRGVFTGRPAEIAQSLKHSAERSKRRKGTPFQSAMSMLTFYINRAGKSLSRQRVATLERAKTELRRAFGRPG